MATIEGLDRLKKLEEETEKTSKSLRKFDYTLKETAKKLSSFGTDSIGIATAAIDALSGFGNQLKGFVAAFNPGLLDRYNLVLSNITAAIGEKLQPAFEVVISALQSVGNQLLQSGTFDLLGDIAETLANTLAVVAEAMAAIAKPILQVIDILLTIMAPGIELLADIIGGIAEALSEYLEALKQFYQTLMEVLTPIFEAIKSVVAPIFDILKSAFGKLIEVVYFVEQVMYDVFQGIYETLRMKGLLGNVEPMEKRNFAFERDLERRARERLGKDTIDNKAIRNVSISSGAGALESARQRISTSALRIGASSEKTEQQKQLEVNQAQLDILKEMLKRGDKFNNEQLSLLGRIYDENQRLRQQLKIPTVTK